MAGASIREFPYHLKRCLAYTVYKYFSMLIKHSASCHVLLASLLHALYFIFHISLAVVF